MVSKSGSSAQGKTRMRSRGICCCVATWSAVSSVGVRMAVARRKARRRSVERGSQTSIPCATTIDFIRGAAIRIPCTTGARNGCPATTSFACRRAERSAVAVNLPLARWLPVKTNSRSPTDMRCSSGESFRLNSRHSILRLSANSLITAAKCRPALWIPPAESSSGKRPIITRRVCQQQRRKARRDLNCGARPMSEEVIGRSAKRR